MRTLSDGTPILAKPKMLDTLEEALREAFDENDQEVLIRVEGYVSKKSQKKANITLNIAYNYKELLQEALDQVEDYEDFDTDIADKPTWKTAKKEVLKSIRSSMRNRNKKDYVTNSSEVIFDDIENVRVGYTSGLVQVRGVMVDYELIEEGEERVVKSRAKTLAKNAILEGTFKGKQIGSLRTMALETDRFDYIFINNMRYDSSGFYLEVNNDRSLRVFSNNRGHSERIELTNSRKNISMDLDSMESQYRILHQYTIPKGGSTRTIAQLRTELNAENAVALKEITTKKSIRSSTLVATVSNSGSLATQNISGSSKKPIKIGPSPGSRTYVEVKLESSKLKSRESVIFVEEASAQILVNLNWDRESTPLDLDLCCLIELKNGQTDCIEAIRGNFGDIDSFPYVLHSGDDLTGDYIEGEYLYVDLDKLSQIKRLCVFAYIYRGSDSWKNAKGIVRVDIPGHPLLEVPMGEQTSSKPLCALCMIEVEDKKLHLERLVSFHGSFRNDSWDGTWQRDLDDTYDWNMNW